MQIKKSPGNKTYWQRVAGLYGSVVKADDPAYRAVIQLIRPHLAPDMEVLELACGSGQLSFPLSETVKLWEATDFSEKMIEQAGKHSHSDRLRFAVQDATSLPYGDGKFDAVVISNALHIMPEPEKALAEAWRVLKPGGLLFGPTVVWGEGVYSRLWKLGLRLTGFEICHMWTCREFEALVESQGFVVTETEFLPDKKTPICFLMARKAGENERQ